MPTKNIFFIDSRVINYQSIIDGLTEAAEVFILDTGSDGLKQMAADLKGRTGIDAIHVISHGSQGALYLGSMVLDSANLASYGSQLASIGSSLTQTGDILLYGCNVAQGDLGLQFINSLAQFTGADVAASSNATGIAEFGGNWGLEAHSGTVDANPIMDLTYRYLLPGDTTAPTLTSLTFPTTINLSSGNQFISFAAHAEDAGSGVDTVNVWFDKPLATNIGSFELWMISSGWNDSTPSDASGERPVQSYNNPGIYNITGVDVKDLAGNSRSYTSAQLTSLGIATSFNVTDGVFIPNSLSATPSTENGKLILSLSAAQWATSNSSLAFSLSYDSSIVHFDSWRAGSSGSYAATASISEVGANGSVGISASINNAGDNTDFVQLVFSTSAQMGSFKYSFSSGTLNSQSLPNIFGDYSFITADISVPKVVTFSPLDEATSAAIASNFIITFSESIAKGTGSITLKDTSGATIATYDAATSFNLTISGNTLIINPSKDLGIFTGYKVEIGAGAIKDLAGNNYAGVGDYNFTTATVDSLYHFFVVAFNAAPGKEYMNQLAQAYNYPLTVKEIVNIFTTKAQFTDIYPVSLSHEELATSLVANIVKNSATAQAKQEAISDIKGALDIGWTVGDMIFTVFGNLANKSLTDPTWGGTAQQFINETAVARYYTEVMGAGGTDLPTLRAVIASVDNHTDVSTPAVIATLIGVELAGVH